MSNEACRPQTADRKMGRAARPHHLVSHRDLFYLRSILRNLDELRQVSNDQVEMVGYGVANEALNDNRDWLDCFIARFDDAR